MAEVTVYGSSDDLIEVEGDILEEFNHYDSGEPTPVYLAFSDGTLLRVIYAEGNEGTWRITPIVAGTAEYSKVEAPFDDESNYSDRVTLRGDNLKWVACAKEYAKA